MLVLNKIEAQSDEQFYGLRIWEEYRKNSYQYKTFSLIRIQNLCKVKERYFRLPYDLQIESVYSAARLNYTASYRFLGNRGKILVQKYGLS